MKILFICRYNNFRSKVAKLFFDKLNKNPTVETKASGLIKAVHYSREQQQEALNKFGIRLEGVSELLDEDLYHWPDKIILVGDDIPATFFKELKAEGTEIIVWKLKDILPNDLDYKEKTQKLTESILKEVKKVEKELQ